MAINTSRIIAIVDRDCGSQQSPLHLLSLASVKRHTFIWSLSPDGAHATLDCQYGSQTLTGHGGQPERVGPTIHDDMMH